MADLNNANMSSTATTSQPQKEADNEYRRRRRAFWNASSLDMPAKKKAAKILRDFVLNEENAALIWRSARVAHAAAKFTPKDFERSLRNRAGVEPANWIYHPSMNIKKDPYRQLELQAWIKYLYYGGSRKIQVKVGDTWQTLQDAQGNDRYADDQDLVMHYFGIKTDYAFSDAGDRQLKCDYSWNLSPVMKLRNNLGGHSHIIRVEELDLSTLMSYYDGLMGSLAPLASTRWVAQEACKDMLQKLEQDFYDALGAISYRVEDIMAQQEMDPATQAQVEDLLIAAGVPVMNGRVDIRGDIRDFSELLNTSWRYYCLSKVSGAEQLRAGVQDQVPENAIEEQAKIMPQERPAAALEKGGAADWTELADRYRFGIKGVEQDDKQAMAWYEKAATADSPDLRAMYELGQIYERLDPPEARAWYRKAANLGYTQAQVQLGMHCENGTRKQTRNWPEAAAWYGMAARQNDPAGLYHLGRCYELGRGTRQDYWQAAAYYTQAQEGGRSDAKAALARLRLYGRGVPKDEQEAIKTLRKLEQEDCAAACSQLGICHLDGIGVKRDSSVSFSYFQRAAQAGSAQGMYYMGWCYENGVGVEPNQATARQWYVRAARKGHCTAQLKCAYRATLGLRWMTELAKQSYAPAQVKLARWLLEGEKGMNNAEDAVRLLQAAKDRSYEAKRRLAECYLLGIGIRQDVQQARSLAEQVASGTTGKDRMIAEGLLASSYDQEKKSDSEYKLWLYWADRAACSGHVCWAMKLVEHYTPVTWTRRSWTEGGTYYSRHTWEAGDRYDIQKAWKYFELAAKYGNSSIARALADFYSTGSAYVPWQSCTGGNSFRFYSSDRDIQRAQYWYGVQCQREAKERKLQGGWREWNYL